MKKTISNSMLAALPLALATAPLAVSRHMVKATEKQVRLPQTLMDHQADCILVLGAGIQADGTPSDMLADRMKTAIDLYRLKAGKKLLLSGDRSGSRYDETAAMQRMARQAGIPAKDIYLDHAGYSTCASVTRARVIYGMRSAVIVTQQYHLYRALYLARQMGLQALGVSSTRRVYQKERSQNLRELLARNKDFFTCLWLHAAHHRLPRPVEDDETLV